MIYLICGQDSRRRIAEVSKEEDLRSSLWEYTLNLTEHRNLLYSYSFYTRVIKRPLQNRVNVIFTGLEKRKHIPNITNAIICKSIKQIIASYKNAKDDVFILGDKQLIETFAIYADYLIVYTTDEVGYVQQLTQDTINFADYNLLCSQEVGHNKIEHLVRVPNFLHR